MPKIRFWTMILVIAVVSILAALLVAALMAEIWFVYANGMLIRAAAFALLFSTCLMYLGKCYVGTLRTSYVETVANMRRYLRELDLVYSEKGRTFNVRLGKRAAVKLTLKDNGDGTDVFFTPYGTQNGLGLVAVMIALLFTIPVSFALSVMFALSSRRFSREAFRHLSPAPSAPTPAIRKETTKELLETSLAEARRVALETYEARRSGYHDYILLLVTAGLVAAALGLVSLAAYVEGAAIAGLASYFLGLVVVAAVAIPMGFWALRRRSKPQIDALDEWVKTLELQLMIESSGAHLDDSSESSFEILASVGKEMPGWMSPKQRSRSFFHPLTSWVILGLVYSACELVLFGIVSEPFGVGNLVSAAAGVLLAALAVLLERRMKKKAAEESARFSENWRKRWDAMMSDSEGLLVGR